MTKYWHRVGNYDEKERCEQFEEWAYQHPEYEFFRPSPMRSPWHVKTIVDGCHVSVYPHNMTVFVEATKRTYKFMSLLDFERVLLRLKAPDQNDDFHVIEPYDET